MHKLLRRVVYHIVIHDLGGRSIRILYIIYCIITILFRQNDALLCRHDVSSLWPKSARRSTCTPIINKCICLSNIIYIPLRFRPTTFYCLHRSDDVILTLAHKIISIYIFHIYSYGCRVMRPEEPVRRKSVFTLQFGSFRYVCTSTRSFAIGFFFGALNPRRQQ